MATEQEKNDDAVKKNTESLEKNDKAHKAYMKILKELGVDMEDLDYEVKEATKSLENSFGTLGKTILGGVANSFKKAGLDALSGSDALATASAFMSSEIEAIGQAAQVGSKALMDAGKILSAEGSKMGPVLTGVGEAAGIAANALVQFAQAGIQFLMKETTKMLDGFKQASQAGVVFAGGLNELNSTAVTAGLTTEQFSKVIANNTEAFVAMGFGATEGAKKLSAAMAAGGKAARDGMYALGMGSEEQAEVFATTMAKIAGPLGRRAASDAQVAELSQQYAADLKVISDITGKNAKAQQAAADAASNNFRMQQEIAKMAPDVAVKFNAALGAMDKVDTDALNDRVAHMGVATDKTTNILETVSPSLKAYHEQQYQLMKQGKLTAESELELHKKYAEGINKELANQEALATASSGAGSSLSGVNSAATDLMKSNAKLINANVKGAEQTVKARQAAGKEGTDTAAQLQEAQQQQAIELQKIANDHLDEFSKQLVRTTENLRSAIGIMANGGATLANFLTSWPGIITSALSTILLPVLGKGLLKMFSKGATSAAAGAAEAAAGAAGGGLSTLGKGAEELAGGASKGAKISLFLTELAEGLTALTPAIPVILTLTAATVGLGFGLKLAAPAFEAAGKAISYVFEGIGSALGKAAPVVDALGRSMSLVINSLADSLIKLSTDVSPTGLLSIIPGVAGLGLALLPFGAGGALAGIVAGTGGFDAIVNGIERFESLDPNKLNAVAGAMKKINESLPSAAELAKMATVGAVEHLFGGDKTTTTGGTGGTTNTTESADMSKLMMDLIAQQKQTNAYLKENVDYSKRILNATS